MWHMRGTCAHSALRWLCLTHKCVCALAQLPLLLDGCLQPCVRARARVMRCRAGGFKLWEGAMDLSAYLLQRYKLDAGALRGAGEMATELKVRRIRRCGVPHQAA